MIFRCTCGQVEIEAHGPPILTSACYCDDCQKASRQLESLPGAPRLLGDDGGTEYVLYRKDRVAILKGADRLEDHRLEGEDATRRTATSCCQSPMFLDYEKGHWFSLFRDRVAGTKPQVQMLLQTRFKPADAVLPAGVPASQAFPPRFIFRILGARLAMFLG